MTVKALVGRRWWWVTLIVIAGVFVLVRLGIWQLDRLDQRRTFNSMVYERWIQEPYDVTSGLPADFQELEYRRVQVSGEARFQDEPYKNKYSHPMDGLGYGAMETGILLVNTAEDLHEDEREGIRTAAVNI